jgi:molybdate transport system regulatory protein
MDLSVGAGGVELRRPDPMSGPSKRPQPARSRPRGPSSARGDASSIRLWIRLKLPGVGDIGPGKIELLRKIREHRSISAAARAMNMSYRRAWLLVEDLNAVFARPVVAKWMGGKSRGGASLTQTGEKLVATYDTVVKRADRANRAILNELWGDRSSHRD